MSVCVCVGGGGGGGGLQDGGSLFLYHRLQRYNRYQIPVLICYVPFEISQGFPPLLQTRILTSIGEVEDPGSGIEKPRKHHEW